MNPIDFVWRCAFAKGQEKNKKKELSVEPRTQNPIHIEKHKTSQNPCIHVTGETLLNMHSGSLRIRFPQIAERCKKCVFVCDFSSMYSRTIRCQNIIAWTDERASRNKQNWQDTGIRTPNQKVLGIDDH